MSEEWDMWPEATMALLSDNLLRAFIRSCRFVGGKVLDELSDFLFGDGESASG